MAKNSILKNFDMDALRRKRAAKSAVQSDPKALIDGLNQIAPEVVKLEPGQTAKIHLPEGIALRAFVMSITAKLSNLTPKNAPWQGRVYDTISDPDEGDRGVVYVQRGEDIPLSEVKERKRGRTGGRRKASATTEAPVASGEASAAESGALVTTH